jgi:hypothetical protein
MNSILKEERDRAEALAAQVGAYIPGDLSIHVWMLPVLGKIVERLQQLEARLDRITLNQESGQ